VTTARNGWADATTVRAAVKIKWDKGDLLRDLHAAAPDRTTFPLRIRLTGPTRDEIPTRFADTAAWAQALADAATRDGWQLLTRPVRLGGLGTQQMPVAAIVATPEDALRLLGRDAAATAARFADAVSEADKIDPAARALALARPHDVLGATRDWPLLLAVAEWVRQHPRPGIYPRQIPVTGMHTKLTERHAPLLTRLLEALLPEDTITGDARTFAGRFGFLDQARRVRLRGAASALGVPTDDVADVEWDICALAALDPHAKEISELLVLENKTSFLTASAAPGRLLVWGSGYGAAELLSAIPWRGEVAVRYWGDIDTHGFAILAQVRQVAPHTVSILMDVATLLAHRPYWSTEHAPRKDALTALTDTEAQLYADLLVDAYGTAVRLEQEYIRYDLVEAALSRGQRTVNESSPRPAVSASA
jgi:hypothetical protein